MKSLDSSNNVFNNILSLHLCTKILKFIFLKLIFPDGCKKDSATKYAHTKFIIDLLKELTLIFSDLSTIWQNTEGCYEKYRCATE